MTKNRKYIMALCLSCVALMAGFLYHYSQINKRVTDTDLGGKIVTVSSEKKMEVKVEKVKKELNKKIYLAKRSGVLNANESVKLGFDSSGKLIFVLPDLSYVKKGDLVATVGFPSLGNLYKDFRVSESNLIFLVKDFLEEIKSFKYILPDDRKKYYEREAEKLIALFKEKKLELGKEMKMSGYPTIIRSFIAYDKAWSDFEPDLILCIGGVVSVKEFNVSFSSFRDAATGLDQLLYDRSLYAPISGYLIYNKDEGGLSRDDYIDKGKKLFELIDISVLKVKIKIPEKEIQYVRRGTMAEVSVAPSFSGKTFNGYVSKLGLTVDEIARDLEIEVIFENPNTLDLNNGSGLLPGMSAEVRLVKTVLERAYGVPKSAANNYNEHFVVIGGVSDGIFANIKISKKDLVRDENTGTYHIDTSVISLPDYIAVPYKHLADGEEVVAVKGGK